MATRGGQPSIYEIFASLGLDASSLDEGLKQAKFDLDAILPDIKSVQDAVLQLDKAFGQSTVGLMAEARAIEFFGRTTDSAAKQVYELHAALLALKEPGAVGGTRSLIPLGNEDVVDKLTANAQLRRAEIERVTLEKEALLQEKAIAAEQAALLRSKNEEEERAFQYWLRQAEARRAARKIEREQESQDANYAFEKSRIQGGAARGGGGITGGLGFRGTATEIQAADQLLGIHIPRGLTSVLARLGVVQTAMSAAFSGFVVIAFIEILGQVGTKLRSLGDEITGFGESSRKAWDEAYQGSRKSLLELAQYEAQMGRIYDSKGSKKPLTTKLEELGMREDEIKALRQSQISSREDARKKLEELGFSATPGLDAEGTLGESLFKLIPSGGYEKYAQGAVTLGDAVDKLRQRYKDATEDIYGLTKSLENLERQKDRNISKEDSAERSSRRMRDRVHEEAYRLPWYLGASPSTSFLQSLEGAPARRRNFIPPPPVLQRDRYKTGTDNSPNTSPEAGLHIENHFSPIIKVDGMATAQIVRDEILPAILNDMANNQRAVTDKMVSTLKAAGVRVG